VSEEACSDLSALKSRPCARDGTATARAVARLRLKVGAPSAGIMFMAWAFGLEQGIRPGVKAGRFAMWQMKRRRPWSPSALRR